MNQVFVRPGDERVAAAADAARLVRIPELAGSSVAADGWADDDQAHVPVRTLTIRAVDTMVQVLHQQADGGKAVQQ